MKIQSIVLPESSRYSEFHRIPSFTIIGYRLVVCWLCLKPIYLHFPRLKKQHTYHHLSDDFQNDYLWNQECSIPLKESMIKNVKV